MPRTLLAVTSLTLSFFANHAAAGNLAETARGVDNKSKSESKSSASESKSRSDDDDSGYRSADNSSYAGCLLCEDQGSGVTMVDLPPASYDLRISAQKVRDSDGSFHADGSIDFGRVGFFSAVDHYFEKIESTGKMAERSEDIRLNLFELAAFARLVDNQVFRADLRIGLAVAASSHFDTLTGGAAGLRLRARATEHIALSAEAKAMRFAHEIGAVEAAAGAHLSIAYLGYRALKFDVGPVLEGPEAGLSFHF